MEKLKLIKLSSAMLFIAILSMVVISSCKEDAPVVVPTDFAALNAKIAEAETLIATTEEGTDVNQYANGSQVILQKVIGSAQLIVVIPTTTQAEADNTVIALQAAMDVYLAGVVEPIDPTTLAGHWKFDDGSGTTATDASDSGLDGTFSTGNAAFGGGFPVWTTDRNGNANSAVAFDLGGWIEVPYNPAINPTKITVSVWVNATVLGGRFMGLQSWLGYKFEVPDHGRPFFTANTADGIWDNDAGTSIEAGAWRHLAVTYDATSMVFYIDGDEVANIPRTSDMVTVTGHNLAIGVDSSKYADTADNYDNDGIIPAAWGNFFNGSLDELRIYNVALTAPQVKSIFDDEK